MRTQTQRAFSLVEVLIAIVVLALGLLGIAAVFPAVVSQQRQATDTVLSASIENSVTHFLKENSVLNKASLSPTNPPAATYIVPNAAQRGWQLLTGNTNWGQPAAATSAPPIFSSDWTALNTNLTTVGLCLETGTGNMRVIGAANSLSVDPLGNYQQPWFDIPLSQRLSPTPYSSSAQPLYVWDFVARRVGAGNPADTTSPQSTQWTLQDDAVQVAVFVRRIDSGIRKPVGATLADVLLGRVAVADQRVPVAEDPTTGRPTFDGLGGANPTYSGIHSIKYTFATAITTPNRHDHPAGSYITLDTSNALRTYARQPGQQFVDSFGVVHTVTAFLDRDPADPDSTNPTETIEVAPPIDVNNFNTWNADVGPPALIFTTQMPTSVFVVTVPTPVPGSTF